MEIRRPCANYAFGLLLTLKESQELDDREDCDILLNDHPEIALESAGTSNEGFPYYLIALKSLAKTMEEIFYKPVEEAEIQVFRQEVLAAAVYLGIAVPEEGPRWMLFVTWDFAQD